MRVWITLAALALPLACLAQIGGASNAPSGLPWASPSSPFAPRVQALPNGHLRVSFSVPPGYALYRDSLQLQACAGWQARPQWPAAKPDAQGHAAYTQDLAIEVPVTALDARQPLAVSLRFQGCQVDQLCFPPQTQTFRVAAATVTPGSCT